jgi:hypothetical protein
LFANPSALMTPGTKKRKANMTQVVVPDNAVIQEVRRAIAVVRGVRNNDPQMMAAAVSQVKDAEAFHIGILSICQALMLDLDKWGGDSAALLDGLIVEFHPGEPPKLPAVHDIPGTYL